ncbi:MAG: hypothetical protein ABIS29_05515 [Vicinamibacterales bacterium]
MTEKPDEVKWEYKLIDFATGASLESLVNNLGSIGWEAVGYAVWGSPGTRSVLLKRQEKTARPRA